MATQSRLVTADEFWLLCQANRFQELIAGETRMMSPSGYRHSRIGIKIASLLSQFADAHELGEVTGADGGFVIARDPDTVVSPDVAFIRAERLPAQEPIAFFPVPPDLVVEVISPSDSRREVAEKIQRWLAAGVPLVWLVDPPKRSVTVYLQAQDPFTLDADRQIDGGDVLPGFSCPVEKFFTQVRRESHGH